MSAAINSSYYNFYRKKLLQDARVGQIIQKRFLPDIPEKIMDLVVGYAYIPFDGFNYFSHLSVVSQLRVSIMLVNASSGCRRRT